MTMYKYKYTGELMTWEEMKQYCKDNFDYGDGTNMFTYVSTWWQEYGFIKVEV